MKTTLTIAGSDSSGGAGIQADIKTMTLNGVYASSCITAITAQNTQGVRSVQEVDPDILRDQLNMVFEDIFPDAVKIGMVSSKTLIQVIAEALSRHKARKIVLDPVMVATSGARLMEEAALESLVKDLLPLADLITPNIPEGEILAGQEIKNAQDMEKMAKKIGEDYGVAVLLKGGHQISTANDLLYDGEEITWFYGERVDNPNTHGTGCTLSSAIAANLAKGLSMEEAVKEAKAYITGCLRAGLDLGHGSGPLDHAYQLKA